MNPADLPDESLFERAMEFADQDSLENFLEEKCAGKPELRGRIEALLAAHRGAASFLDRPGAVPDEETIAAAAVPAGAVIGRYKLLERIGEGGMGVVYMAEQTEPVVRRVALKVIKMGMDTRRVVARFEAERQALALMDHPNIARVLDAGATPEGRPYFVMELVRGIAITDYCDRNRLSPAERIGLFIQVCQAIQHAHQKGVVHRDIKPGNVMVTLHDGVPVPKVIDFGVARAINQRLTEKTLFTNFSQMIGTPAYMSPEQAEMSGLDIDTRADIYSLGVLLYELLAGSTPFPSAELLRRGYAEMQRVIANEQPPKPSTRMSTLDAQQRTAVAANRGTDGRSLSRALRGDLDWIVMKCLEKDRTRRYESCSGLAEDLRRHLRSDPVNARPPTIGYILARSYRRHRAAFLTAAAITVALVGGISVSIWQAVKARQAEAASREAEATARSAEATARDAEGKAKQEAARAEAIADVLGHILQGARPSVAKGRDTTILREMLEAAEARIARKLDDQPAVKAAVVGTVAGIYQELQLFPKSIELNREAYRLSVESNGRDHPRTVDTMRSLAWQLAETGKTDEAIELQREAITISERIYGPTAWETATILNQYSASLSRAYRWDEAAEAALKSVEILRTHDDFPSRASLVSSLGNLASVKRAQGDLPGAVEALEESVKIARETQGNYGADALGAIYNLANLHAERQDADAAEASYREVIARAPLAYGERSILKAYAMAALADLFRRMPGRSHDAEAEELFRDSLAMLHDLVGDSHVEIARNKCRFGTFLIDRGKPEHVAEGEQLLGDSIRLYESMNITRDTTYPLALDQLARHFVYTGRYAEAEPLVRRTLAYKEENDYDTPGLTANSSLMLGVCLAREGEGKEALEWLDRSRAILEADESLWEADIVLSTTLAYGLAEEYQLLGELDIAASLLRRARDHREDPDDGNGNERKTFWFEVQMNLAGVIAETVLRDRENPELTDLLKRGRAAEADLRSALEMLTPQGANGEPLASQVKCQLATAVVALAATDEKLSIGARARMLKEAESLLLAGHNTLSTLSAGQPKLASRARDAARRMAQLYDYWSTVDPSPEIPVKVQKWRDQAVLKQ